MIQCVPEAEKNAGVKKFREIYGLSVMRHFYMGNELGSRRGKGVRPRVVDPKKEGRGLLSQSILMRVGTVLRSDLRKLEYLKPLDFMTHRSVDISRSRELLVQHGAGVNKQNNCGGAPLHRTSGNGRSEVARFLIERESDLDSKDGEGRTSLHAAARGGHTWML
ncbi:hypothetical protein EDB89DRAFT_1453771 [Lactarius sanguifluus]|nr:hypothetical protein EDB89DRAFT_1453771 [Lactarius sanguifluus]